MAFFTVIAVVSFCLEISHHFVQVARTRRCGFAPPWSTAAAETEPTEFILETLEQSDQRSLIQYLAYQDLCESGETYKRIVTACLKPLEEFTSNIAEALEGYKPELSQQSNLFSAFDDSQIVPAFIDDLRANAKPASSLEKNWIGEGKKPSSEAVLVQKKLSLFLEYRSA
ncbi:hypothetical protein SETIT_6G009900v2 [Setaria italica]|uniref:Uncharacterized protein n=1 Tax=Setaria italica TaxID=4555 RepID=K3YJX6_SETIT|nr:hypothetical protein SETIT_6G009900v2 [Setaria italica]